MRELLRLIYGRGLEDQANPPFLKPFSWILFSAPSQFLVLAWISFGLKQQVQLLQFNREIITQTLKGFIFLVTSGKTVCSSLFHFQIGLYQKLKKVGKTVYFLKKIKNKNKQTKSSA